LRGKNERGIKQSRLGELLKKKPGEKRGPQEEHQLDQEALPRQMECYVIQGLKNGLTDWSTRKKGLEEVGGGVVRAKEVYLAGTLEMGMGGVRKERAEGIKQVYQFISLGLALEIQKNHKRKQRGGDYI